VAFSRPAVAHKRTAGDAEISFGRPFFSCYACHDTGIVVNGDDAVNERLPDYDRLPDGRRVCGSDLALICHCAAAYPRAEGDRVARAGYREADGSIRLLDGRLAVGSQLSNEAIRRLHERRAQGWALTERAMNDARRARIQGEAGARPWFIAEVAEHLRRTAIEAQLAAPCGDGLQSIGSCLVETLSATGSPLVPEATAAGALPVAAAPPASSQAAGQVAPDRA